MKYYLALALWISPAALPQQTETADATVARYMTQAGAVELERVEGALALRPHDSRSLPRITAELLARGFLAQELPVGIVEATVPEDDARRLIADLRQDARLDWVEPVYRFDGKDVYVTGDLFVDLGPRGLWTPALRDLRERFEVQTVRELDDLAGTWHLRLSRDRSADALDVIRAFAESGACTFAEPLFYWKAGSDLPDDPLFPDQWGLENTPGNAGLPGADISACAAWEITRGHPSLVVAVIDEGVDVGHPDLAGNLVTGLDTTDQNPPDGIPGNARCQDNHGTACAGIVAALADNGLGVTGVAPRTSVLPVRIGVGGVWTTNQWAAAGIRQAYLAGADVLSNSWGGGPPSTLIEVALWEARTLGRGGLGCFVVFASGNDNSSTVSFPASSATTFAVGASSPCDERKSPTSCDGEPWWGSNFGNALDLVAPGVLVPTTDNVGGCGAGGGDFITEFNGTSAATPYVAGVAALMYAVDRHLEVGTVEGLIRASADDLGVVGWDSQTGAGRLNARGALDAVLAIGSPEVWVDASHGGPFLGTQANPFGDLPTALAAVRVGGVLHIVPGAYAEVPDEVGKEFVVEVDGDGVFVGQ